MPETKNNLSKFRYSGSKALNESSIDDPKPVKTNFGISNPDNIVKAKSTKSFVQLIKETLDQTKISKMTKTL